KADAQTCGVDPALHYNNVTLMTRAKVERLEATGRVVNKVHVTRDGDKLELTADIVVVSAGAINSAALLLKSGIANSSDTVGRHYMGHVNSVLMAISKCPNPTIFQKSFSVNDFYFGSKDWEYPMG